MADQNQKLEQLKQKYASAIHFMQQNGVRLSHINMQGEKLYIQGEAPSEEVKNKAWDQIKLIDSSYSDLICDLTVSASAHSQSSGQPHPAQAAGSAAGGGMQTYTVKPGDSLSKISQEFYGSAGQYMKIFDANKDQLSDPNQIRPGQVLKIPK